MRSDFATSVLLIALEISICRSKGIQAKVYGPLLSMLLLLTDCLSLVCPRSDWRCFLHELAVEFHRCPQQVIGPNFFLAHFIKIRQLDR